MIVLNRLFHDHNHSQHIDYDLYLTAEQRKRSYQRIETKDNQIFLLKLPRGTHLHLDDILISEDNQLVQVKAQPEEVITVTATTSLQLLKGAYHLGNRHIPLEITPDYLRLTYDRVLEEMLIKMGLKITIETAIFEPETGAYHHH